MDSQKSRRALLTPLPHERYMVAATGIEPVRGAYETPVLPLDYAALVKRSVPLLGVPLLAALLRERLRPLYR